MSRGGSLRGRLSSESQREGEAAAVRLHRLDPGVAAVRAGDVLHQGETDAASAHLLRAAAADESLEDPLAVFLRDARAVVRHAHLERLVFRADPDPDAARIFRVLEGVVDEVYHRDLHGALVRLYRGEP